MGAAKQSRNSAQPHGAKGARPAARDGPNAVYVFTPQGMRLALQLAQHLECVVFAAQSLRENAGEAGSEAPQPRFFSSLAAVLGENFSAFACHIFISATGIAVRAIAPCLDSKLRDPAVLVIDQRARFVISLLSGHLGGANAMAARVSGILGATPVISTATDLEGLPALDSLARERGLFIENPQAVKAISSALLAGRQPGLYDPDDWLGLGEAGSGMEKLLFSNTGGQKPPAPGAEAAALRDLFAEQQGPAAAVTDREFARHGTGGELLLLRPPSLVAGIGCKRGVPAEALLGFLSEVFSRHALSLQSLCCLASLSAKRDEEGLAAAARELGVATRFFSAGELSAFPVTSPSAKARELFGVQGVCEPAALAAASKNTASPPVLLLPKVKKDGMTLAVARRGPPVRAFHS